MPTRSSPTPEADDGSTATPVPRRRRDPRREQTPLKLIAAARVVFERDGFFEARLADITDEAKVASGTLYRYYSSKHEIFGAVMAEVVREVTGVTPDHVSGNQDPVARLREANRVYVRAIRRNARLMTLMYQVREADEGVRQQGDEIVDHLQGRAVDAVRRWQAEGLVYPDLDAVLTAHALTYMVERVAMAWLTGRADYDEEAMVAAINGIWERALGLGTYQRPGQDK
ncbi:TetR/AcrR family transcriptional regulator [Nocardioides campestrisoli]|uniref:TetR/AcrR family transcriptional regulator n=1 Tax=Nocardioides campestrisoli TaxID=2736757 RepID=UPI0015E6C287|nr:TetR/AcrR family transcriptional regulator [Nocardioides campestrisoli]